MWRECSPVCKGPSPGHSCRATLTHRDATFMEGRLIPLMPNPAAAHHPTHHTTHLHLTQHSNFNSIVGHTPQPLLLFTAIFIPPNFFPPADSRRPCHHLEGVLSRMTLPEGEFTAWAIYEDFFVFVFSIANERESMTDSLCNFPSGLLSRHLVFTSFLSLEICIVLSWVFFFL